MEEYATWWIDAKINKLEFDELVLLFTKRIVKSPIYVFSDKILEC